MSVVEFGVVTNNDPVLTPQERKRLGKRLRLLRLEQDFTQVALAQKAEISPGTLQNIEWGFRKSSEENINKLARALGTSLDRLLGKSVDPQDQLLKGLNREDLDMARAYHEASSRVRQQARRILQDRDPEVASEPIREDLAQLLAQIARLPEPLREYIATLAQEFERLDQARQIS